MASLLSYGEEKVAGWAREASGEELQRTLTMAECFLNLCPHPKSGVSLPIDTAIALAGVYVNEGQIRDLCKNRRDLHVWRDLSAEDAGATSQVLQEGLPRFDEVDQEATAFWHGKSD